MSENDRNVNTERQERGTKESKVVMAEWIDLLHKQWQDQEARRGERRQGRMQQENQSHREVDGKILRQQTSKYTIHKGVGGENASRIRCVLCKTISM